MQWWGSPTQLTLLLLHFISNKKLVQAHFANSFPHYQNARSFSNYSTTSRSHNQSNRCVKNPFLCQSVSISSYQIPVQQDKPVLEYAQPTLTSLQIVPQLGSRPQFLPNNQAASNLNLIHPINHRNSANSNYYWPDNLSRIEEGSQKGHEVEEGHGDTGISDGWGWGEMKAKQKHIPHKKKKGKKGALAKIFKKFRPKSKKRQPLVWKEERECDGWENFLKDLEIISWILGIIGFIKASFALLLHIINQSYGFVSIVKIGLPERLTTFVDLIAPGTTPEVLRTILAVVGLVDYLITLLASYPLGNLIVLIDGIAEALTIPSLILATITIFDDLVEQKVWSIFGIDVRELFDGYGCSNPFSKEKEIEHFFTEISSLLSGEGKGGGESKGWGWGQGMEKRRLRNAHAFAFVPFRTEG